MSTQQRNGRLPALLALPVLCCVGHAVLLAVGVSPVTAAVGGATGTAPAVVIGLLLLTITGLVWRARPRARP